MAGTRGMRGGLFGNGQIGVYGRSTDSTIPVGINTLNTVPAGYEGCHQFRGGGINKSSIKANFGRNCSNVTNPPANVRYIQVVSNEQGDCLQIAQLVVNAFVDGVLTNVAGRGTPIATDLFDGTSLTAPIDGTFAPRNFPDIYHSTCQKYSYWQLDLGQDYSVTQIIYYNRADGWAERSNGATIILIANDGTTYPAITLTGAATQSFNVTG
jgi:hypothetical protein